MRLRFLCFVFIGLLLSVSVKAATAVVDAIEIARNGESKDTVCARSFQQANGKAVDELFEQARESDQYHPVLDKMQWQGESRASLEALLRQGISDGLDYMTVQEVWTGKSCLNKGIASTDLDALFTQIKEKYASKAPPAAREPEQNEGSAWGLSMFMNSSRLGEALAELSIARMAVVEYWLQQGVWPKSLAQLGFTSDELVSSKTLKEVTLEKGGVIHALLKGNLDGEWIRYRPLKQGMNSIGWECETSVKVIGNNPCS
ncbi:MAG: pilin [Alcanivoracaceae bacterium]|nr:pilin [Alcanivoracaceae bacterium]